MSDSAERLLDITATIVSAHVGNNSTQSGDLPNLIETVYGTLRGLGSDPAVDDAPLVPAVPVKKSVFEDYIVCLEDGKKLKMLKRHLATSYGLTPQDYRKRWGLPADYPMVAPTYSEARRTMAKSIGLGRKPGQTNVAKADAKPDSAPRKLKTEEAAAE